MKFDKRIDKKYRRSVEDAFETVLEKGNATHRRVMSAILDSKMLVRVLPVSKVYASGVTGIINSVNTNKRIESERLSLIEALDEVYITIAEETIDTGGQRGCEGTFVHEGQHAFDFAQVISSFSYSDLRPLSIFDPTLYELEWAAHKTSGDYMMQVSLDEYLNEGLDLMILGQKENGSFFVDDAGIKTRLQNSYGLTFDGNQGASASGLLGIRPR